MHTSNHLFDIKLNCHCPLTPGQFNAENPKSSKQSFKLDHVTITYRSWSQKISRHHNLQKLVTKNITSPYPTEAGHQSPSIFSGDVLVLSMKICFLIYLYLIIQLLNHIIWETVIMLLQSYKYPP